jgi:hypothetical protein
MRTPADRLTARDADGRDVQLPEAGRDHTSSPGGVTADRRPWQGYGGVRRADRATWDMESGLAVHSMVLDATRAFKSRVQFVFSDGLCAVIAS